tara:strand:- start:428 stop:862 length:435 start_codon:yes stop_codon:yes gene_type:complete
MYKLKNYVVQEFVDKKTYQRFGDKSIRYLDVRMLKLSDWLREKTDSPITINNWHTGGQFNWSGIRTTRSSYYSDYSGHSWGSALDYKSKTHSAAQLQQLVIDNWEEVKRVTGLEGLRFEHPDCTPTWCHMDSMQTDDKIYIFRV